jgi:phosphate transport system substrate-binding protein
MPIATRLLLVIPFVLVGPSAHAGELSVVGTGDGIDLLRALGAAYTADHPETNVIVPPSIGSGGGIAAVGSNKEVLARAARPLSDSEKEAGLVATPVFRLPRPSSCTVRLA